MRIPLISRGAARGGRKLGYQQAVADFLAAAVLSPASLRVYRVSLANMSWLVAGEQAPTGPARRSATPPDPPLAVLGESSQPARLAALLAQRASIIDPASVNRELAILRRACKWWVTAGLLDRDPTVDLVRLPDAEQADRRLDPEQVAAIWDLPAQPREVALWRLIHETGQPVESLLALDVPALLPPRDPRLRVSGSTSRVLALLLAGRSAGPAFLTARQAPAGTPVSDVDPASGRGRLSYRRAAEVFEAATRELAAGGDRGWTLNQLRRSAPGAH